VIVFSIIFDIARDSRQGRTMMEREHLIKHINMLLVMHCDSLKADGSGNLQDSAVLSEYFFRDLLNCAYGWQLEDANDTVANTPGYDLVDDERRIFVQVSKDASREKIKKSLEKIDLPKYGPVPKVVGDAFQPGSCPNSNRMEKEAAIP
jgi:hypothetical protein